MVDGGSVAGVVVVDSTGVVFNTISIEIRGHRPSGVDFTHDLKITASYTIFTHSDGGVVANGVAAAAGVAVHASVDGRTLHVDGLILLASDIRDSIIIHPLVGCIGVSTTATSGVSAVDEGLDGWDDVSLNSLRGNFDSISD